MRESSVRYRPELDGLRAVAVLLVIGTHMSLPRLGGGSFGVDIFFVLSGYLISTVVLAEWATTGAVSLRRFYARRALRLYPALVLVLVLGAFAAADVMSPVPASRYWLTVVTGITYTSNFFEAWHTGDALGSLRHLWSLGVEEQFYLAFPPLLLLLLRRGWGARRLAQLVLGLAVASMVFRIALFEPKPGNWQATTYFLPWAHADGLLVGCVLALALPHLRAPARFGKALALGPWLGLAVIAAATVLTPYGPSSSWTSLVLTPVVVFATAAVVGTLTLRPGSLAARALSPRPVTWLGRVSYSAYLVHPLPLLLIPTHPAGIPYRYTVVLRLAAVFGLAAVSYYAVERPFLRLKRLFEPDASAAPAPAGGHESAIPRADV